jgi:hypothetical protein
MNIWQFAAGSPWLAFFLALIALAALEAVLRFCINRPLRAMNIRKHGWPPPHCDADGDFRKEGGEEIKRRRP